MMNRWIVFCCLQALFLCWGARDAFAVSVHDFNCKDCHRSGLTISNIGGSNVCLTCHGDPPTITKQPVGAFVIGDASNVFSHGNGRLSDYQTSHAWVVPTDNVPAAGAQSPSRILHPQFYSQYGGSSDQITCARCHNPHAAQDNPQLLVKGPGSAEAMCRACHEPWAMQTTGNYGWLSHPLVSDYAAVAAAKPDKYRLLPANSGLGDIRLVNGEVACTSCHGVHFTDSSSATANGKEQLDPDYPGYTTGLEQGDGKLLRADGAGRDNKSALCQSCHTYQAHGNGSGEKVGCLVCHSGHSYDPALPNYFVLRKSATTTTYGTVSGLDYSNASVTDGSLKYTFWNDRVDGTANGYCEKCHGDARTIGSGAGDYHVAEAVCTDCHRHGRTNGAFIADCTICHGMPPVTAGSGGPEGLANQPGTTGSTTAGAHAVHSVIRDYSCYSCHANSVGSGPTHISSPTQKVSIGFILFNNAYRGGIYNGQSGVAYDSSQADTTVTSSGARSCVNVYCHGGTMAANGGANITPVWDNPATGSCGKCHGATSAEPPLLGSHRTHVMNDTWSYAPNTESPFNNYIYGRNLACTTCHDNNTAAHVDGSAEWSFDTDTRPWLAGARYKGNVSGTSSPVPGTYGQCSNLYCHSIVQTSTGGPLTGQPGEYKTPTWGVRSEGNCGACHFADQGHSFWAGRGMGFTEIGSGSHTKHLQYLTTVVGGGSNGPSRCGACHNYAGSDSLSGCATVCHNRNDLHVDNRIDVKFPPTLYGAAATYSSTPEPGNGYGTCANVNCHGPTTPPWGETAVCGGCHEVAQGNRVAVIGQFSSNSHHVQGTSLTGQQCYQCHWEANSDGTVNPAYHGGSTAPGAVVDLVIYGAGSRPAAYTVGATAIQYAADGSRGEITEINSHCIGCHSDQNNATTPFGDGKTPKQYAWDGTSVGSRYSQAGTTPWGKYADTASNNISPKSTQTKAYSAHGNATANQGGWNLNETWPNTRAGSANIACYDCHNSHGSSVSGKTTSYASVTANGGLLKETVSGRGGYAVSYKPVAGGTEGIKNARNPGASLCFDCHLTAAGGVSTPWGYQSTFGATQQVIGYYDTPYLGPGDAGPQQRYPYRQGITSEGGHFGASSPLGTPPMASIDGLCTPCHDPHGVSPTLGINQKYGVPLLKGTWLTSPYLEDVAPEFNSTEILAGNYLHIDQNTFGANYWELSAAASGITESDSQFAGLCLNCHAKGGLSNGTNHTWKSKDRIHESVKGWKTTGTPVKHNYPCSKCHTPHVGSSLPRLMVTNCLDSTHKGRTGGTPYPAVADAGKYEYSGYGTYSGRIPNSATCHEAPNNFNFSSTDQSWNQVTPWYTESATLAITAGPTTGTLSNTDLNLKAPVSWTTNIQSNSRIDYGPTTDYGLAITDTAWVTGHNFQLQSLVNHTTYHYRVSSRSMGGQNVSSSDQVFYISFPPTVPALNPAADNSGCSAGCEAILTWNAATDPFDNGPIQYYAELSTSPAFTTLVANSGWISTRTWTAAIPQTNTTYYWRVKSRDANHVTAQDPSSSWSTVDSFIVSDGTAPVVSLAAPAPSSVYGGNDGVYGMTFTWGSLPPAPEYQVQVSTDPAFNVVSKASGWITTSNWYTVLSHPLSATTMYYWRVQAKLGGTTGPWSPVWSFAIVDYGTSSCPFLFTWDGEKFSFEADLYGAGKLATKTKTGYLKPEPNDYYLLKKNPAIRDGAYELRLVEERYEIDYLDEFKLYAIDVPRDRRVFAEKPQAGSAVAFTDLGKVLHTVSIGAAVPSSVIHVNTGVDVTAKLAMDDEDYVVLNEDKNVDFTYQTLELDLGAIQQAPQVKIVMDAMSMFPDSEEGVARSATFGARTVLEVQDQGGNWVKVPADKGSLPKAPEFSRPYVFDISNIWLSDSRKVRFTFLFKTYVDWILLDTTRDVPVTVTEVPMVSATLGVRGIDPKTSDNELYEYIYGDPTGQTAYLPGSYTRQGDVKPLVAATDDKFVIYGGGDEIIFTFLPIGAPASVNRRSYVVYTNGYYKDVKVDVPHTVEPLPFSAMSNFPYDEAVEHYPDDADHTQYRQEYNTRVVSP